MPIPLFLSAFRALWERQVVSTEDFIWANHCLFFLSGFSAFPATLLIDCMFIFIYIYKMVIKQKAIVLSTSQFFLNPLLSVVKKIKTETLVKERKLLSSQSQLCE